MFVNIASAEIQNNLSKTQEAAGPTSSFGLAQIVFSWIAVFVGVLGVVILAVAFFLYLVAAGEEPYMKRAHDVLWGGIFCLVGAIILYLIGRWLGA